jgi:DNA repair protein RadC
MDGPFATAELMTSIFAPLADRPVESCAVLYLDTNQRLRGTRHVAGRLETVPLTVRTVAADALAFDARAVVMAHNHPSGDPSPSREDVDFTRQLARGLDMLGVCLRDHIVLAGDAVTSMRAIGVL